MRTKGAKGKPKPPSIKDMTPQQRFELVQECFRNTLRKEKHQRYYNYLDDPVGCPMPHYDITDNAAFEICSDGNVIPLHIYTK
jgi:hypothetical protein